VKFSDENSDRDSENDKRCVLEARLKGLQPLVVTNKAEHRQVAVAETIDKIKYSYTVQFSLTRVLKP
jgi:hypothetical protein